MDGHAGAGVQLAGPAFVSERAGLAAGAPSSAGAASPSLSVEENEKRLLREALLKARGNRTRAAELMGVSRRTQAVQLAKEAGLIP